MGQLSAQAKRAMADVVLLQGEAIERVWEGNGFYQGTGPVARLTAIYSAIVTALTGGHLRIYLVLTTYRVLFIESRAAWCGFWSLRRVNAIALSSLEKAGVSNESLLFCLRSRRVHIQGGGESHNMIVKRFTDDHLKDFLAYMSTVILRGKIK